MTWLAIIGGLVILTIGADLLLRGATTIARRAGLSELLIGLTLVGFGTSTPELVSSLQAAREGSAGIAVGNVVGSNIANILLILGATALLAPVAVEPKSFRRDAPALVFSTALGIGLLMTGGVGRVAGGACLAAIAAYIFIAYLTERKTPEAARHEREAAALPAPGAGLAISLGLSAAGLTALIFGAKLLVGGAIGAAAALGVSETIIGLTIVAVGTSLPELVTSIMAALHKQSDLALGNIVGSNIYNILGILGATALFSPVVAPPRIVAFDNWVMAAATLALVAFAFTRGKIERWEGGVLLAGYIAYIVYQVVRA